MKISLQWLNDYVDHKLKCDELVHRLTMAGLEVEDVHDAGHTKTLQMEITPNRPDCLSILGVAREVSAICQKPLKFPKIKTYKTTKEKVSIAIDDRNDCGRYIGTVIKNVQIKESPRWLKERIEALGMKPINNVVDITNFCLMEFGQPLHAFDYDQLEGKKIVVRRARKGEEIKTLDGQQRKVDENVLVIADASRPVAVAGIMGGEETQITAQTKNILLESAHFSFGLIRRTTRALGLTSDSAYRFERGVHWPTIERCANRAVDLILELAGGHVEARTDVVAQKSKAFKRTIRLSLQDIEGLLGVAIPLAKCKTILTRLGFSVKTSGKNMLNVDVPDFRNDITQPVDVIEELARIVGFDRLPMTVPHIKASNIPSDSQRRNLKKAMYDRLIAQGCNEIVTFSMTNQKSLEKSLLRFDQPLKIVNPLSQEQELMRPSLLPGFLSVLLSNVNHGEKNLKFFELGRIYLNGVEGETLAILVAGQRNQDWRVTKKEPVDFFDLKGIVEHALMPISADHMNFEPKDVPGLESGQSAECFCDGKSIGFIGRVATGALNKWDIKIGSVYFAQIDIQGLYAVNPKPAKFVPMVEFPAVIRDISLGLSSETTYDQIKAVCYSKGGGILKSVRFIEQYTGEKIQAGHRGIVFSLTYQSPTKTLKEEDVNVVHEGICQALINEFHAVRR